MANLYKGYSVDFVAFWNYYRGTARTDYSRYRQTFNNSFMYQMKKSGFSQGVYSNTVNLVEKNMTQLCKDTRVDMLSRSVPDAAVKQIITSFKKWFASYYK